MHMALLSFLVLLLLKAVITLDLPRSNTLELLLGDSHTVISWEVQLIIRALILSM